MFISRVRIDIPKTLPRERVAFSDHKACHDVETALTFASVIDRYLQQLDANAWLDDHNPCSLNSSLNAALFHASSATLPTRKFTARRPWISFDTFILIDQRDLARADGDFDCEANLWRQIKQRVKSDKARWLDNAIASGDWKAINSLRRKPKSQHLVIDALHGQDENTRAETLAEYFESVQWAVRPVTAFPTPSSYLQSLHVNCNNVSFEELRAASSTMKRNRQCGADSVPAELLHAICLPGSQASEWILMLFQQIWLTKRVPDDWHLANIAAILKK